MEPIVHEVLLAVPVKSASWMLITAPLSSNKSEHDPLRPTVATVESQYRVFTDAAASLLFSATLGKGLTVARINNAATTMMMSKTIVPLLISNASQGRMAVERRINGLMLGMNIRPD